MKSKLKLGYPLWLALIIYWVLTVALLGASLTQTGGHFGYPLDDTYIHMAIGKHLINEGFWGVSLNGFSSSTSSPLWTFLIALTYKALGINAWTPFLLCLLVGSLIVYYGYTQLRKITNPLRQTVFLVLMILLTPLPVLTLMGMEHALHSLLTIWLIYSAATYLTKSDADFRPLILLLILAGLVTLTRYEGLFLVFSIALWFLIKKRYQAAFLMGAAGLLPITIYGIFSITQGWNFLPNSVLLKGNAPVFTLAGIAGFLKHLPTNLIEAPSLLLMMIALLSIYFLLEKKKISGEKERTLIAIFIPMTLLHLQFASVGWFYRYEAYLVLAGSLILLDLANTLLRKQLVKTGETLTLTVILASMFLFLALSALRAGRAFQLYPIAVMNIYEQQYQIGLFLEKYYSGKSVAANDIGAINYLADIRTLDLFGLASMEVAQARQNGSFDKNSLQELALKQQVEIVVIYNSWFEGKIPADWIEIGRWHSDDIVVLDDQVSFYAPGARWEKDVTANLQAFSKLLPATVEQSGSYMTP